MADSILFIRFIRPDQLFFAGAVLLLAGCITVLYCLYLSARRNRYRKEKEQIKLLIDPYISESVLLALDTGETNIRLPGFGELQHQCRKEFNRQVIINELVLARKNLSGQAAKMVEQLYTSLQLQLDSEKKLSKYKWFKKAKGVQELSLMNQRSYWKHIYRLTNHANEHVRMEAQAGVVRLLGFIGLRFLNSAKHQITEWQQINLLYLLQSLPAADFKGIERWLSSHNSSVVIFALKLVASFRKYELHDLVVRCLQRHEPAIRMQAFKTLSNIYNEETALLIIRHYASETKENKLEALKTLASIGSEEVAPFLAEEINNDSQTIRVEAARALMYSSPAADQVLKQKAIADQSWNTILAQLENELRA